MAIRKIAVIGGGLAGCASAFFLSQENINQEQVYIDLFEQEKTLAAGASGNDYGVIYPRLELQETRDSIFYRNSFNFLLAFLKVFSNIDYHQSGTLIIPNKKERLSKFIQIFHETGNICGYSDLIIKDENSLLLNNGGFLSPKKLAKALASRVSINIFTEAAISDLCFNREARKWHLRKNGEDKIYDLVVIANSYSLNKLQPTKNFFIEKIKGQVSKIADEFIKPNIKQVICKDCYLIPPQKGYYHFGATFERNINIAEVTAEGHMNNMIKLNQILSYLKKDILIASDKSAYIYNMQGRAGFRTYSKDRMPLIGALDNHENLYINACHGSRGLLSAIYGGFLLAKSFNKRLNKQESFDLTTVDPNRLRL